MTTSHGILDSLSIVVKPTVQAIWIELSWIQCKVKKYRLLLLKTRRTQNEHRITLQSGRPHTISGGIEPTQKTTHNLVSFILISKILFSNCLFLLEFQFFTLLSGKLFITELGKIFLVRQSRNFSSSVFSVTRLTVHWNVVKMLPQSFLKKNLI